MTADRYRPLTPAISELQAEEITFRIGTTTVLDRMSLTARAGRILGIIGPSGSGKTTLLHVLAGLQTPSSGRVLADGQPVPITGHGSPWTGGLILQTYGLAPLLTAAENIALPLQLLAQTRPAIARKVNQAVTTLGLENVADLFAGDLSGGEQQRTAVARALITEPRVILADEPSSALDGHWHQTVIQLLADQATKGAIVIIATHDDNVIARCHDLIDVERTLPL